MPLSEQAQNAQTPAPTSDPIMTRSGPSATSLRVVRNPQQDSAQRRGSKGLQLLGLAMVLGGIGIIFAGEFEFLPRSALTSGIGAGIAALGVWVSLRGRQSGPPAN
jgi:hypothetical protein